MDNLETKKKEDELISEWVAQPSRLPTVGEETMGRGVPHRQDGQCQGPREGHPSCERGVQHPAEDAGGPFVEATQRLARRMRSPGCDAEQVRVIKISEAVSTDCGAHAKYKPSCLKISGSGR